jgi:DNA repair exonuclease SbcCD ATPase subunit
MLDENLIATLEQSLRQTRNAQQRLITRLNEVETEANRLRSEIEALENSAAQTEQAIYSLLATMRSGNQSWNLPKNFLVDDDYDIPQDIKRSPRMNQNNQNNYNNQNNQNNSSNNYRNNQVSYINNSRNIPSISPHLEPVSHRFTDRTITQACTLLLREYQRPLHVNEIYNLLVSGGMEFTGNNPTISIAVSLNRNRKFRKVAPGTFDLILRDASQTGS